MKAIYRAYCRSCMQANCDPRGIFIALVIFAVAFGLRQAVVMHESTIVHGFLVVAATALSLAAGFLLIQAMRTVVRAVGQHYAPACPVPAAPAPGRVIIGEYADGSPATAPVPVPVSRPGEPAFTYTLREPLERVPGKSDLVTPRVADMAGMAAEADALAHDDMEILVSRHGTMFECAEPADLLEGP
jgi:hypothetical protein